MANKVKCKQIIDTGENCSFNAVIEGYCIRHYYKKKFKLTEVKK